MFLRGTIRKKNGKEHRYWSIVENKRVAGGKVRQRHVLYLGEINASQERAWRKSIEVLDEQDDRRRTLALFPEDRCDGLLPDTSTVRLRLSQLCLYRPRIVAQTLTSTVRTARIARSCGGQPRWRHRVW